MENSLAKKSDTLKLKYKFFLNRLVTYFSFLLIPVWIQHTQQLNLFIQSIILLMYMVFMGGQWYLLGKELDHRLKIYYRANSSMDRIVYRIVLGSITMILLFNFFTLLPQQIWGYIFWTFFAIVGLFYSWPTRGKIIEESMTDQLGEFKFLDSFEKTVLVLSALTFFISLPELPMFENIEALKLYFDPKEQVSGMFWNFLSVLYYPFSSYPKLYNLIWSFHFFFFGMGVFLFSFYCILRYFFSRRLSMLGVFSIISTWSFSRILGTDYFSCMSTTVSLIWLWSIMWSTKSGTYRSGLLCGLLCAYATMLNGLNFILLPVGVAAVYFLFLDGKTLWFKKQWLKYNLLGSVVALGVMLTSLENIQLSLMNWSIFQDTVYDHLYRKAFFVVAPIGVLLLAFFYNKRSKHYLTLINLNMPKLKELLFGMASLIAIGILINPNYLEGFSLMWMLAFMALIPLEWVFQSISRLRSKRNLIYAMYILICILDSHLENRLRIVGRMFLDTESFSYFIQL